MPTRQAPFHQGGYTQIEKAQFKLKSDTDLSPIRVQRRIEVRGARVHNLKNLNLDLDLGKLIVVSGVSGSGKSSLAFDTLFLEGQRRYIESFSTSVRRHLDRIERPDADQISNVPVAVAIRTDRTNDSRIDARSTVATVCGVLDGLRLLFARIGKIICLNCQRPVTASSPASVAAAVAGLSRGTRCQLFFKLNGDSEDFSAADLRKRGFARAIWDGTTHELGGDVDWPTKTEKWIVVDRFVAQQTLEPRIIESAETAFREGYGQCGLLIESSDSSSEPVEQIDGRVWRSLPFSKRFDCLHCDIPYLPLEPRLFSPFLSGACPACRGTKRVGSTAHDRKTCQSCQGTGYRAEARAVCVDGVSLPQLLSTHSTDLLEFLNRLETRMTEEQRRLTDRIRAELVNRATIICDLALNYFTFDRAADSLSPGELRRLMLGNLIGSRTTGMLVVVDEPTAGVSSQEIPPIYAALKRLQAMQNTVVVVDHSPELIELADELVEIGPGSGPQGGSLVFHGRPADRLTSSGAEPESRVPKQTVARRGSKADSLTLSQVNHHSLQDFEIRFPLRSLCVVEGRSGSGKTSLLTQVLYPLLCQKKGIPFDIWPVGQGMLAGGDQLSDVALVDQSPLTRSSRSNPATWLGVFDEIRATFAATADAKRKGFTPGQFSFNSTSGGRCRSCLGTGRIKQDMQFLPDLIRSCPECQGSRFRKEVLEVKYRGRSIADVLNMTVVEASTFFRSQPRISARFEILKQFGLDYLVLGQPTETLSGGEAQRMKLASRLITPSSGQSLIICDEPTAGLHPRDVLQLTMAFREFIENGHSLIVADNSPELIEAADFVFSLPS